MLLVLGTFAATEVIPSKRHVAYPMNWVAPQGKTEKRMVHLLFPIFELAYLH